ncbi:uncharacterized protein LOC125764563 isoform X1 [Anopheles funestus]|uniref:uncharacterized protein LOC125764563 isoform X1 n=1 Tax=Anopheles funestus TaxID=62324 RepID=UPI0020C689FD|nr:uncharacterized protein LOC125764563 isoform X1 [Anopheles funestus]
MENSSQNDTPDRSVSYTNKVLRQSSEDFFREVFAIDDLTLQDGAATDRKDSEIEIPPVNYRTLYKELVKKKKQLILVCSLLFLLFQFITCFIYFAFFYPQENEFLQNKLRKSESKLLQVIRDRNFLLDRLLVHEERLKCHRENPTTPKDEITKDV